MSGIIQYLSCGVCLLSLSTMLPRFAPAVGGGGAVCVNFLEIYGVLAGLCPRSCRATRGREAQIPGKVTQVILRSEGWGSLAPGFTCLHFSSSHAWR